MFIAALFTIAKTWKQPKCPLTEEWIKKMWCVCVSIYIYRERERETHTYTYMHTMEYYLAINNAICSNVDGPRDYHISQKKKDKYHMVSLICGI